MTHSHGRARQCGGASLQRLTGSGNGDAPPGGGTLRCTQVCPGAGCQQACPGLGGGPAGHGEPSRPCSKARLSEGFLEDNDWG